METPEIAAKLNSIDDLHLRTLDVLSGEVTQWTLLNADCYPRVALWLEYADRIHGLSRTDVLDLLDGKPSWLHPDNDFLTECLYG